MTDVKLSDISCFVQVAQSGSISAAAKDANMPKATISHQIRRLEDTLGVDLFVRLPRRLELTDQGSRYLTHCHEILEAVENSTADIKTSEDQLVGRLSVAVASEFGTSTVGPVLKEFAMAHPSLKFDVEILSDSQAYFENLDIDCLIYVGAPPDSALIGKRIWSFKFKLYAGGEYLDQHGAPATIDDIDDHQCIKYLHNFQGRQTQNWELQNGTREVSISPQGRLRSPNFWMVKYFVVANMGIGYLPDFFVETESEIDLVRNVLPDWQSADVPVYALYPRHRHGSRKVTVFIDLWQQKVEDLKSVFPFALVQPESSTRVTTATRDK